MALSKGRSPSEWTITPADVFSFMFFFFFFFWDRIRATYEEKTPKLVLTSCVFVSHRCLSSDTVKGCSSSSWAAASLRSTMFLLPSEKNSSNPHIALPAKEVCSSPHHSLRSQSYTRCSFTRTIAASSSVNLVDCASACSQPFHTES